MDLMQLSQWLDFSTFSTSYLAAEVFDLFPYVKKNILKARSLSFWREGYVTTLPPRNLTQTNKLVRDTVHHIFAYL